MKLIPYSVYLPPEYYDQIRELAKQRKASGLVRDAICLIMDGGDQFKSGYNKGINDAIKTIVKSKELKNAGGDYLKEILETQIRKLEQ
jgi:predicted DNA-binding protein